MDALVLVNGDFSLFSIWVCVLILESILLAQPSHEVKRYNLKNLSLSITGVIMITVSGNW